MVIAMANWKMRRTAKISALDAARVVFFIIAGLAVRSSLLFLLSNNAQFPFLAKAFITLAFLFTTFRFCHGIAVVYELEKRATETTTTPSSKKVEQIFALFAFEGVCLYLMAERLAAPSELIWWAVLLLIADLEYVAVSKTLKDSSFLVVMSPSYWARRWRSTSSGTAPRTHLQWAMSDVILAIAMLLTFLPRAISDVVIDFLLAFTFVPRMRLLFPLTTGSYTADWSVAIAALWICAGVADYKMNGAFYFGGIHYTRRKCVFVCSPLKPPPGTPKEQEVLVMRENIRTAQWYCRQLFLRGDVIPYASHCFYPYFLDDTKILDRKLGRRCALEFLMHCDALYIYTPQASSDMNYLSQGMKDELAAAKEHGLEIRYLESDVPPHEFKPSWSKLTYSKANGGDISVEEADLEGSFKKVFVCSQLRGKSITSVVSIRENIRLAQWLCHQSIRSPEPDSSGSKKMLAVFAPHAFYPYFTDYYENAGLQWLESALDILKICDAIYVYTADGLENDEYISRGMRECIDLSRDLGLEVKFRKIVTPPNDFQPALWKPAIDRKTMAAPSE